MEQIQSVIIDLYTEATPNPETLKFVVNKVLYENKSADFQNVTSASNSPLAMDLFGFPFVKGVFIMNNFITITKHPETIWEDIMPSLKAFIKKYVQDDRPIIIDVADTRTAEPLKGEEVITKIKEVLENYVKPAVEMDGGAIQYKHFDEEDGKLSVMLQGSCSGCPSSMITLKSGIENLMKRMVPEVKEVVADAG
jgi:NFU1 iron-sulfur cluster scaffold homolog, mitochondrial